MIFAYHVSLIFAFCHKYRAINGHGVLVAQSSLLHIECNITDFFVNVPTDSRMVLVYNIMQYLGKYLIVRCGDNYKTNILLFMIAKVNI